MYKILLYAVIKGALIWSENNCDKKYVARFSDSSSTCTVTPQNVKLNVLIFFPGVWSLGKPISYNIKMNY